MCKNKQGTVYNYCVDNLLYNYSAKHMDHKFSVFIMSAGGGRDRLSNISVLLRKGGLN